MRKTAKAKTPGRERGVRRAAVWFAKLAKRLLLKKSFIALLLLIPLLGGMMALAAKEQSGILTVILVAEGPEGDMSHTLVDFLTEDESVFHFKVYDSEDAAKETVRFGKADAAWVFPAGLEDAFERYAKDPAEKVTLAKVYQTEENTLQRISREKLNGAVFTMLSKRIFDSFAEENIFKAYGFTDKEALYSIYDSSGLNIDIVNFEYLGSAPAENDAGYLVSPIRGLSYLAAFLCTLAASLYSMRDEKEGFFSRIPVDKRLPIFFASNLAASLAASAVALISLALTGAFTSVINEIAAALAFALASASFCTLLCRVFSSPFALGAAIPPMTVIAAVVCPIFISIKLPLSPEMIFPVTYAVRSARIPRYIAFAAVYSAVCLAAAYVFDRLRRAKR